MAATSGGSHLVVHDRPVKNRKYRREHSLIVNVRDNSAVRPDAIIEYIHEHCGIGSLYACVPKSGNLYEITLDGKAPVQYLLEGIKVGNSTYEVHEVVQSSIIVSFLHLPAYIDDEDIEHSLRELDVELLSSINRRFYPGTTIADGTRYVRVKLPPNMSSFPYTMKFHKEYYRCIHNGQLKVCSLCYSADHLFRECPRFVCFRCKQQGHYARTCKNKKCEECREWEHRCDCSERVSEHEYSDIESEIGHGDEKSKTDDTCTDFTNENKENGMSTTMDTTTEVNSEDGGKTTENTTNVTNTDEKKVENTCEKTTENTTNVTNTNETEVENTCGKNTSGPERSTEDEATTTDQEQDMEHSAKEQKTETDTESDAEVEINVNGKTKRKKKGKKKNNAKKNK